VPGNPNRAAVQALCEQLIGNANTPFNTGVGGPSGFAPPFFAFERELIMGNDRLASERAETYTLGVVLGFDDFSAAVDFYDVDIDDAISPLSSLTVYEKCLNADATSNPTYTIDDPGGFCALITRNPQTGRRNQVDAPYFNQGGLKTSGVDFQFNWGGEVAGNPMAVNFIVSYLAEFATQATPESPFLDAKGTLAEGGQFDYRMFTTVRYDFGPNLDVGLRWRHLPAVAHDSVVGTPTSAAQGADAYDNFDVFGGWQISQRYALRFGVDNLFNTEPEVIGEIPGVDNALGNTSPGFYDTLGRRFYLGLKMSF
jgi:outer membrane receptor protein involved in Fe transport